MAADPESRALEAGNLVHMLHAFNTLPKPLICALQGNAFGGGVGMASVCDVAIGVDHLKMGLTETRLGIIPATIGPYVLARMGEGRARRRISIRHANRSDDRVRGGGPVCDQHSL